VEGDNQPGSSNSEGQTFDRIELAPFEEKTIPALPRDYIALENFLDLFRQDIKVDCTVTPSVPKHIIQSLIDAFIEGYPVYMETNENDKQQVVRVYNKADFTCANGRYFILYKLEGDYQPVPEKFYCNAEATGSSEDRCETHCIECIKYEKGMGSETFIAKWNKHIKGTSYPVAGDDKPTWLRITENLDVGGAAVMYDRDNPNVPLVYTIDEFHALGMAPSNKLDKFCMVHVMDNEFLSKHVIDTPSDKSNIDLYNMDLHERIDLEDNLVWVLRVPGGWVYESVNPSTSALASVFVPFNNEFQQ
jgi:hypothetical protein